MKDPARSEADPQASRVPPQLDEQLFRALTLHSGDIISLLDGEGRLLYNSPATERINGFTPEELANMDTFELIHPDDQERVGGVFQKVLAESGAVCTVQYRYRTKAGSWLWMEAIASNQLDNPAVRGVVTNSRDISERVKAEEERARMRAQMLQVQKLESLGVLAGGVAHDFNNLLTIVLGEADLILEEQTGAAAHAGVERIRNAAERAAELTQLLLAYAGKGHLDFKPTSLGELVRTLEPLLKVTVGSESQFSFELEADEPWIYADPRQLRQVVLNLVQNASESSARPVSVQVRVGRRQLDASGIFRCVASQGLVEGLHAYLEVSDNGDGMTREALERIFDPFFSTKQTGRGLGLAAVRGIIQGHKAGVSIDTRVGEGTQFVLYFPLSDKPAVAPTTPAPLRAPEQSAEEKGTVLVVDDNEGAARLTARMLESKGFSTIITSSGEQALQIHATRSQPIALVVLDMVMPGLDGAETLRRLREQEAELPIVLYSGFDDNIAAQCIREPRTAFLQKPFSCQQLTDCVRDLLPVAERATRG